MIADTAVGSPHSGAGRRAPALWLGAVLGAAAGLLAALVTIWAGGGSGTLEVLAIIAGAAFGIIIATIDARSMRIPNALVTPMAATVGALIVAAAAAEGQWHRIGLAVAGAALLGGLHLLLMLRGGGAGDMKLAAVIGLHLGYYHLALLPAGLLIASGLAAVAAIVQLARGHGGGGRIPFGPFLVAGYLAALGLALGTGL